MNRYYDKNLYAVILAGGVGSRFWPFSRELEPKQFLDITGDGSLIQNTVKRLQGLIAPGHIYVVSRLAYLYELKKQLKRFRIPESNILLEPEAKNTAPAIGLAARLIGKSNKDARLIILPSDHYVCDYLKFKSCIKKAFIAASADFLVTIGVKPHRRSCGYGYIKIRHKSKLNSRNLPFFKVEKFIEKPSLERVKKYLANRDYFWNSGIFVCKAYVFMKELKQYLPHLYSKLMLIDSMADVAGVWKKIRPISVDYGILEKSRNIVLIPATFKWADLGSWDALNDCLRKDKQGNIIQADSFDLDSKDTYVFSRSQRLIATLGLKNVIIADTPDALLVANRGRIQEVRRIVDGLKLSQRKEYIRHLKEKRPWGSYTVLETGRGFKIKLVEIESKKRLSLQSHAKRAEHWVVVSGYAKITYLNKTRLVYSNQSIFIPRGTKHRLENPSNSTLKIVEVQTGNYLEEDDIRRFNDDFQR